MFAADEVTNGMRVRRVDGARTRLLFALAGGEMVRFHHNPPFTREMVKEPARESAISRV